MSVRVTCPFCATAFDLPAVPAARRTPCPRCGESVPVSDDAERVPDAVPAPPVTAFPPPASRPSGNLVLVSLGLTLLVAVAFAVWWSTRPPASNGFARPPEPSLPPATKPPAALSALKYLPRDTQAVFAVQPAPLVQYAARTGKEPTKLFEELGLPRRLFDGLTDAGFPPESIDHVAFAASAADLWLLGVLVAREPIDDGPLRQRLKARVVPDKPGRLKAELGGLSWQVQRADDRTLLFALLKDANLDAAAKPTAGLSDLPDGLKQSVGKISPAAFAWLATDATDWSKVQGVAVATQFAKQPELAKRLDGVRAAPAGLSFEPEMRLGVAIRAADGSKAKEVADAMTERLTAAKAEVKAGGEWAEAAIPFDPPGDALALLRKAVQ